VHAGIIVIFAPRNQHQRARERKYSGARAAAPIFHSKSLGVKKWRWLRVDYAASADEILRPMMRN
jgi:hypothetical protein